MLSKSERNELVDKLFSNQKLLREAAKTLYGSEDEAYDLTKRELQIVLTDATDYEVNRLNKVCESVKGPDEYTNAVRGELKRHDKEDYGSDDFPQGSTRAPQKRDQRRTASKGDNPLRKTKDK